MRQFRAYSPLWRALAGAVVLVAAVLAAFTAALALDLKPDDRTQVPGVEISYLHDPGRDLTLAQALDAYDRGEARPIEAESAQFGHVFDRFWLFVSLANNRTEAGRWSVATRAPYVPGLQIWLRRGPTEPIELLDLPYDAPFGDRVVPHRLLISEPFVLEAAERADLVIAYNAGGGSSLPFTLESDVSLRDLMVEDSTISGVFYAFSVAAILFFALGSVAMRMPSGVAYAGLFGLTLLFLAQMDGLAFQFLWPNWPQWNGYASLSLILLVSGVGFAVAGYHRNVVVPSVAFRRVCYGIALSCILMIALIPVAPLEPLAIAGYILVVLMLVAHVAANLPILRLQRGRGLSGIVGLVIITIVLGAVIVMILGDIPIPALLLGNLHRIVYLVITLATMLTMAGYVVQLRRDHEQALEREIVAAQRDAELNRELFETERNYARARDIAALRQRQLASATHDIRQPLASLRLSLDSLVGEGDAGVRGRLKEAFDYLEDLTGTFLADAREEPEIEDESGTDEEESAVEPTDESLEQAEPYPISLITGTVDQMFREEAVSKGLAYHVTGSERQITVPVLPLMRLVSNLVSNAVKYTVEGSVSVTAGEAENGLVIAVEDTGPGMAPETLAALRQAGNKGDDSQGEGLGLAIADDVAAKLGITVGIDSAPGRGTCFRVVMPAALTAGAEIPVSP